MTTQIIFKIKEIYNKIYTSYNQFFEDLTPEHYKEIYSNIYEYNQ